MQPLNRSGTTNFKGNVSHKMISFLQKKRACTFYRLLLYIVLGFRGQGSTCSLTSSGEQMTQNIILNDRVRTFHIQNYAIAKKKTHTKKGALNRITTNTVTNEDNSNSEILWSTQRSHGNSLTSNIIKQQN